MKTIFNLTGPHFKENSNEHEYKLFVNNNYVASAKDGGKLLAHVYFLNLENNCTDFEVYTNENLYTCTHYLKDYYDEHKEVLMKYWKPITDLSCTKL